MVPARKRHPIEVRIAAAAEAPFRAAIGFHARSWTERDNGAVLRAVLADRHSAPVLEGSSPLLEDDRGNALVRREGSIGGTRGDGFTTYHDLLFVDGVLVSSFFGHDYGNELAFYLYAPTGALLEDMRMRVRAVATEHGLTEHGKDVRVGVPRKRAEPIE